MATDPNQPNPNPDFFGRLRNEQDDRAQRSRQLCRDFYDFCESLHHRMNGLHQQFASLPPAIGLKGSLLTDLDRVIQRMAFTSGEAMPNIQAFIDELDAPGPQAGMQAMLALHSNLRTIPGFVNQAEIMHKLLKQSIEVAKMRGGDGPASEKPACREWVAAAEPVMTELRYEIDTMKGN